MGEYLEQIFPVKCKGRDYRGKEVLDEPVEVKLRIGQQPDSNTISSNVDCPYNTGAHKQRCKASHPNVDTPGVLVYCPYSFDIPYALEESCSYNTEGHKQSKR